MTDDWRTKLDSAWAPARARGILGPVSIESLEENAAGFVPAAFRVPDGLRCIDLGSGAGVPGILLALADPSSNWVLVDATQRRCEHAEKAVLAMDLGDRVAVVQARVEDLAHDCSHREGYDLVVARLFGIPSDVAECGIPYLVEGGRLVASTDTDGMKVWQDPALADLGGRLTSSWSTRAGRYVLVERTGAELSDRYPRRAAARKRGPTLGA